MTKRTVRVGLGDGRPLFDVGSYGRLGRNDRIRFSKTDLELISRTARRAPEVVVKVSGGGTSTKAVAAHFAYIDRHGDLEIETDDGQHLVGHGVEKQLVEQWDLETDAAISKSPYSAKPGRKPTKLAYNVVLSMPARTPPDRLLAASRSFAREQFGLKHRYAMVLHTDQDHPHVHMVLKAIGEDGKRLHITKATLREWRHEFARHLRDHGIEANATNRAVRGKANTRKLDGIYRAALRGESTHMRARAHGLAAELAKGRLRPESGKAQILRTRDEVETGWWAVSDMLARQGETQLARHVVRFIERMDPPRTEKELLAVRMYGRQRIERAKEERTR